MNQPISKEATATLFTEARSFHNWTDKPVSDETLHALYELTKWGPTSINLQPARIVFVHSAAAKETLLPLVMGSNVEQIRAAPVTAILAYDEKFYLNAERLFPAYNSRALFENDAKMAYDNAFRNSSMQGGYMIMAARALGLDVCPMSGFNNAEVDKTFFKDSSWKSNFICTIGYGDRTKTPPRNPRLTFEEACKIL